VCVCERERERERERTKSTGGHEADCWTGCAMAKARQARETLLWIVSYSQWGL
jgi:hypothetical protein